MKISQWLSENIDSHGIYDVSILDDLPAPVRYVPETDMIERMSEGKSRPIARIALGGRPVRSMRQTSGAEETGDPKGAWLPRSIDESSIVFGGYALSSRLDTILTGEDAGVRFFGRGSAHRACITHLSAAGF